MTTQIDIENTENNLNTKEAYIKNARKYLEKKLILLVPDIEPFDGLYVKQLNLREMTDYFERCEEFTANNTDGLAGVRGKALMIVDGDGNQMFNPNNREDVYFLSKMPIAVMDKIVTSFWNINGEDGLKKLLGARNS